VPCGLIRIPFDTDRAYKLAQIGMVSPRMYYLDDFVASKAVYIGYIGPHLTNTQTN
jgi:hypothetical protein